jgi:hypothetical protein
MGWNRKPHGLEAACGLPIAQRPGFALRVPDFKEREVAVVVLTRCSSGFGLEGALAFARNGDRVYATMRNTDRGQT